MTETKETPRTSRADAARAKLLDAALPHAAFDGWSEAMLDMAAEDAGLSKGEVQLYLPRGVIDLIETWSRALDAEAEARLAAADLASMKIREKVTFGVLARLEAIGDHEEAARRARARLSLPDMAADGPRLVWATSDMIWRAIGDPSTDWNFYSKRTILSGVYTTTLAMWLGDQSEDKAEARAFLDRRIQNVMDFEKTKAKVTKFADSLPDPTGLLARMRYGFGPRR